MNRKQIKKILDNLEIPEEYQNILEGLKIPEEIKKFLDTKEGRSVFWKIAAKKEAKQTASERKKAFLNPPKNVRKWLLTLEILKKIVKSPEKT